jgi:hypothetical protein
MAGETEVLGENPHLTPTVANLLTELTWTTYIAETTDPEDIPTTASDLHTDTCL